MKTETLLLLGGAAVAIYLLKKKQDASSATVQAVSAPVAPTPMTPNAVPFIADTGNGTTQIANAASVASPDDTGVAPAQFIDDQGYEVLSTWGPQWGTITGGYGGTSLMGGGRRRGRGRGRRG